MFTKEAAIRRPNTVEEVAAVAVLLASDAGRNITGCLFPIDGGTLPY
jgi:enoyl-[acyl-carrier-protein] reductase (NADH)